MTRSSIEQLQHIEERLKESTFTQETTELNQLNQDFSPFNGKSFKTWLEELNEKGKELILEIGGGKEQIAAQQILTQFPQIILWEIELRPVNEETRQELLSFKNYQLFQMGFSQALDEPELNQKKFSLIFAHNVLNHLPNPFFVIENCYQLLKDEGILFVNEILIYEEEWEKIAIFLQEQGYQFSWKKNKTPSSLIKKGIISVALTIIKNQREIHFPLDQGQLLTDFQGKPLAPFEYFFNQNSKL